MSEKRSKIIIKSGIWLIVANFLLAVFNLVVGLLSNSLAIVSDAAHSLTDATSGILIIASEKLANSRKFNRHRAKIERVTTIIIALIIIVVGIHIVVESVENILDPEPVDYNAPTIIVLIASIAAKFALATYLKKKGRAENSTVLTASGAETMNDTLISVVVLVSAIVYLIWHINVESYVSLLISVIIMKVGLEFIFPHLSAHHHHPLDQHPDHGAGHHQNHKN